MCLTHKEADVRVRVCVVGLLAGGLVFLTGCPLTGLLDELSNAIGNGSSNGSSDRVIPDGTYAGKLTATSEWRDSGEMYWQGTDDVSTSAEFAQGALVAPSGDWVDKGYQDSVDRGTLQISREVSYVEIYDWGYEVDYDLTGTWKNVPLQGTEYVTYELNNDGTVTVNDTLELISLDSYDGGRWVIHTTTAGTLAPSNGAASGGSNGGSDGNGGSILDKKSG